MKEPACKPALFSNIVPEMNSSKLKLFAAIAALIFISVSSAATAQEQSAQKDSLEFHSIDKNDIKRLVSFARINPHSKYAPKAEELIRELNKSSITESQALEIALQQGFPKERIAAVKGIKDLNVEHILVILAPAKNDPFITISLLAQYEQGWKKSKKLEEPHYINDSNLDNFKIEGDITTPLINGKQYIYFRYSNSSNGTLGASGIPNNNYELVLNLYSISNNTLLNMMYIGRIKEGQFYGKTMDANLTSMATIEQKHLVKESKQENIQPYLSRMFISQDMIQWWYDNNTSGSDALKFGIISNRSDLIPQFKNQETKINTGQYTAAVLKGISNNNILVVYNKSSQQYSIGLCNNLSEGMMLDHISSHAENIIKITYTKEDTTAITKILNLKTKKLQ